MGSEGFAAVAKGNKTPKATITAPGPKGSLVKKLASKGPFCALKGPKLASSHQPASS